MCHGLGIPSERAVLRWSAHRPEFRRQYDIARELGGQHLGAEGVLETADGAPTWRAGAGSPAQPFIAGADFPCVACAQRPARASSALGCPREADPTLLQFVANDVDWLSPIDHQGCHATHA